MPSAEYDARRNTSARIDILSKVIPSSEPPGLRILDVGAGTGWLAKWAADRGHTVTAVDPDLAPIEGVEVVNERWEHEDIEPIYDFIVGLSVLHHVNDWHSFVDRSISCSRVVIFEPCERNETRPAVLNFDRSPVIYDYLRARGFEEIGWSDSAFGGKRPVMAHGVDVGSVAKGWGSSTRDWGAVGGRVSHALDRDLYPGTLNVWRLTGQRSTPPYHSKGIMTDRGLITAWETRLNGTPVVEVIMPYAPRYVREFMSEVNLREHLNLQDGERVVIG